MVRGRIVCVMAKTNPYADGYQQALADVAAKLTDDGFAGACRWIEDNGGDAETRETGKRYRELAEDQRKGEW